MITLDILSFSSISISVTDGTELAPDIGTSE